MDEPQWEKVTDYIEGTDFRFAEHVWRLPVPGGWLYKYVMQQKTGWLGWRGSHISHNVVFVPKPIAHKD